MKVLVSPALWSPLHLISALVKSGTSTPAKCTPVMPAKPLADLFGQWPVAEKLNTKELCLKAVTFMALTFMSRLSDLVPITKHFDPSTNTATAFTLSCKQLEFHDDGHKNDTDRSGFEIRIPGTNSPNVDIVHTLKTYVCRTKSHCALDGPLFIGLQVPNKGLKCDGIHKI